MATIQEFDYSVDVLRALLWQYDGASRLRSLAEQKAAWYQTNQTDFWTAWFSDVFSLDTANDFGLAVWARILNVPLVTAAPATGDRPVFGFGSYNRNFYNGNFGRDTSGTIELTTGQKRLVLKLRAFQLISNGTVPQTNQFLASLFADQGAVYVLDGLAMNAVYVFTFVPDASLRRVLENFDMLPRPAGVDITILVQPETSFGFAPYYSNFENSNFGR